MTNFFALTTRGLEAISAGELATLPDVTVTETAYRRVAGVCAGSLAALVSLRTVDDVYLDIGTWEGIGHTRDTLAVLQWYATQLPLEAAVEQITTLRALPAEPLFSVTASFVGRRNYSSDEIKQTIAAGVRAEYTLHYTADDRQADLNIRLFIEHEKAFVGLRLGKHPLHERAYKIAERAGSLKPPVAAAMLMLAQAAPGERLLDPCCGSGTILIEGALMGLAARGGDIEPEAVAAAQANAQAAGAALALETWDARALMLPEGSAEIIVSNLPWGRQITVDAALTQFYADVCREAERVLAPGGRIVLLSGTPELLRFANRQQIAAVEISLFGQTPYIVVYR